MNYLAQLFGLASLALICISYQQKKKENILFVQIFANLFYFIQYILLAAFSAASANIISIVRTILFYNYERKDRDIPLYYLIIFELIIVIVGIFTYTNIYSIIPITIALTYAYGTWQKNSRVMYSIFLLAGFFWILYNFIVGAYISIIGSVIEISASAIGFIKMKKNSNEIIK